MSKYDTVEFADGKGYKRNGVPEFYALLEEMADTHDKKNHDYASQDNPSGNYHYAGEMAVLFSHSSQDAGFAGRLAEKVYRIANLEGAGKTAKNESLEDTERDIAVIAVMWMADRRRRRKAGNPLQKEMFDLIKLMPTQQQDEIVDFINAVQGIRAAQTDTPAEYNDGVMWSKGVPEKVSLDNTKPYNGAFDQLLDKGGAGCTAPPKDATDDVSTFNLLLSISRMINEYLSKMEIRS